MAQHAPFAGTPGTSTRGSVPFFAGLGVAAAIALFAGRALCQETSPPALRPTRLERIQAIEGDRFSQEKFDAYRHRKAAGVVLTVAFPALLITSLLFALEQDPGTILHTSEDVGGDPPRTDAQEAYRVVAWVTLVTAVLSGVIGISLLTSGVKGKHRQIYLRDNAEPGTLAIRGSDLRLLLTPQGDMRGGGIGFAF